MALRAIALSLVWLASIAPLAVPGAGERFAESSRIALAALPWIVLLGVPRSVVGARRDRVQSALGASLLAVPVIALGLALDLAAGAVPRRAFVHALLAVGLIAVLALAAERAAQSASAARSHAIAWMLLVPGFPALVAALELGGEPMYGRAPAFLGLAAEASPLAWVLRAISRSPASGTSSGWLDAAPTGSFAALIVAFVLLSISELFGRHSSGASRVEAA